MPRTPSLTDFKRNQVCTLIAAGFTLRAAAAGIGCSERTLRRERARNQPFRDNLRDAEREHAERRRWLREELGLAPTMTADEIQEQADSISPKADSISPKADSIRPVADSFKSWFFRTLAAEIRKRQAPREAKEAA